MDFTNRMRTRARARGEYRAYEHVRPGVCFLQHDMDLANQAGASYRSDNNNALVALATLSSGTAAPATSYAYQLWADTTAGLLKQRNAANTAWLVRGTLAETFVLAKSAAYTVIGADFGRTFIGTGTFTLSLTAAATLVDGFVFWIRNDGSGVITIDPNGAETIDGAATITLVGGEGLAVFCNGASFYTVGRANINGLTEDTAPDLDADYVRAYDANATAHKKVKLGRAGTGVNGTLQATTSGTAFDFTIPAWAKEISLQLRGVSLTGTDSLLVQIGTGGVPTTTGYVSTSNAVDQAGGSSGLSSTAGFVVAMNDATFGASGRVVITLMDPANNVWVSSHTCKRSTTQVMSGGGDVALAGALNIVRLTRTGTDTFDAGSVNVLYR